MKTGLIILGNQLFPHKNLPQSDSIFMAEDMSLCSHFLYHQQKIVLFLSSMRYYCESLRKKTRKVIYHKLEPQSPLSFEQKLTQWIDQEKIEKILFFEIEDKFFEKSIKDWITTNSMDAQELPSPMFLTSRAEFKSYLQTQKKPFMKTFYQWQRTRLGILVNQKGQPHGGQWSFDEDNRKKLPKDHTPPSTCLYPPDKITQEVIQLVKKNFSHHPGDSNQFAWPVTREDAVDLFKKFVDEKLSLFGTYQDAITTKSDFVYHSLLTPAINLGLITPYEVITYVLQNFKKNQEHIASYEGFIRQVIGWREFVRGIYQNFSEQQDEMNFWNHQRQLKPCWYDGTTGIPVLDDAILKAKKWGYSHHIERLMIFSNFMTLTQVQPQRAHQWFMEMFIDSSDWVMGPNVYGMGLWSDGGIFATKPYICGSNYYLKMSDYKKEPWCDTVDGLYWNFVHTHRDILAKNHRFGMMIAQLNKIPPDKMQKHITLAQQFIDKTTTPK